MLDGKGPNYVIFIGNEEEFWKNFTNILEL